MRRSEVLAARWNRFGDSKLLVGRGRVAIGSVVEENMPKSKRSRRDSREIAPHTVAAWHGHDPAVSLRIYNDPRPEDLRAAGASLFE